MKNIQIISRADDAGSSRSANAAIAKAMGVGYIKNVSLMACCDFIDEAADLMRDEKSICFGIHATLNAEWDKVKWKPLTNLDRASGLVDENGYFLASPRLFYETKPSVETALKEYDAQLNKLIKLGFNITYVDSHMYEEAFIEGLSDAKCEWAAKKGLLYHGEFNNFPDGIYEEKNMRNLGSFLASLPDGQYLHVTHPALYSEEMLRTGDSNISGQEVARMRDLEARVICDVGFVKYITEMGIATIRYDEARYE